MELIEQKDGVKVMFFGGKKTALLQTDEKQIGIIFHGKSSS